MAVTSRIAGVLAAVLLLGTPGPAAATVQAPGTGRPLVTWAASTDVTGTTVNHQTVRNRVTTSVAGRGLQIQLSNVFGGAR